MRWRSPDGLQWPKRHSNTYCVRVAQKTNLFFFFIPTDTRRNLLLSWDIHRVVIAKVNTRHQRERKSSSFSLLVWWKSMRLCSFTELETGKIKESKKKKREKEVILFSSIKRLGCTAEASLWWDCESTIHSTKGSRKEGRKCQFKFRIRSKRKVPVFFSTLIPREFVDSIWTGKRSYSIGAARERREREREREREKRKFPKWATIQ